MTITPSADTPLASAPPSKDSRSAPGGVAPDWAQRDRDSLRPNGSQWPDDSVSTAAQVRPTSFGFAPSNDLHTQIVDRWGFDIVSGAIPAETRQSCDFVAAAEGVSRAVIREVARVLEAKGLLKAKRRLGLITQSSQHWDFLDPSVIRWRLKSSDGYAFARQLLEVLAAVTPSAARLAAANSSPAARQELTDAVAGMSAAARSGNLPAQAAQIACFYRALLRASNNPLYAGLTRSVDEIGWWAPDLLVKVLLEITDVARYVAVVVAIQTVDAPTAEFAMHALYANPRGGRRTIGEVSDIDPSPAPDLRFQMTPLRRMKQP